MRFVISIHQICRAIVESRVNPKVILQNSTSFLKMVAEGWNDRTCGGDVKPNYRLLDLLSSSQATYSVSSLRLIEKMSDSVKSFISGGFGGA